MASTAVRWTADESAAPAEADAPGPSESETVAPATVAGASRPEKMTATEKTATRALHELEWLRRML
jgi:hypothetical protein